MQRVGFAVAAQAAAAIALAFVVGQHLEVWGEAGDFILSGRIGRNGSK